MKTALNVTIGILALVSLIGFLGLSTSGDFWRAVLACSICVASVVFLIWYNKK